MGLARDRQRSKVYACDGVLAAFGGAERIETLDEIQAWLMSLSRRRRGTNAGGHSTPAG
jgi:hypothetical protein